MTRPWLGSYGNDIPPQIDADTYPSIVHMLDEAIARHRDRPAFVSFSRESSFAAIDRQARAFSSFLQHELGLRKGDRVAVMLPNILAFPIAMLGIVRAGGVQVNVNPLYTARELEHQLCDAGAKIIVVCNESTPTLAEVITRTGIERVVTVKGGDGSDAVVAGSAADSRLRDAVAFSDALTQGSGMSFTPVPLQGEDLLFLQYTGGTTGLSKGAALSHRNLVANTLQYRAVMQDTLRLGNERIVTALPLYHIFALMVNFISYFSIGATNWLVPKPRDMDSLIDVMKHARPTVFVGVNSLFAGVASHARAGEIDFSELRLAIGGGTPILRVTSDAWKALTGIGIHEGYGLSETSPVLTFNPCHVREFTGTVGIPLPSTDIKLIDDQDVEVALGQRGEICAKGPQVMSGYWQKPAVNAAAFTEGGYFRTGDIGQFDDQGYLRIVDRKKDMIIVSGFNVYPNEVEAVASAFPGVAECACIGAPDAKTGERVLLYVVMSAGAAVTEAALIAHCRRELAAYKVPRSVCFLQALPKSTVGKILRRELRNSIRKA